MTSIKDLFSSLGTMSPRWWWWWCEEEEEEGYHQLITPASPACQHHEHGMCGTCSPAEPRRDDCPRAEQQPGNAWRFLHPVADRSKERGVKLGSRHNNNNKILYSDTFGRGFFFSFHLGIWNLRDLIRRGQRTKGGRADGRTSVRAVHVVPGRVSVCGAHSGAHSGAAGPAEDAPGPSPGEHDSARDCATSFLLRYVQHFHNCDPTTEICVICCETVSPKRTGLKFASYTRKGFLPFCPKREILLLTCIL